MLKIKLLIAAFLSIFSVSIERIMPQKIESKNGIRLIHNERIGDWKGTNKVNLELVRKIGGLDMTDESLAFKDLGEVAIDSKGCLYILDRGNDRIQVFSPDSTFLRSIGRHGQGPADFQFPCSLTISPDDKLFVMDYQNRRIQILTPQGKMEAAIKLANSANIVRFLSSGNIVMGGGYIPMAELKGINKKAPTLLSLIDRKGKIVTSFGEFIDYGDLNVNLTVHRFDLDVDKNDNIYISFRYQNRIEKYSADGMISWRADRTLSYGTDVIDKGFIKKTPGGGSAILGPSLNTVSQGIAVDGKGRVWVITQKRQLSRDERSSTISVPGRSRKVKNPLKEITDIYKFEIFNSEGTFLGEIPIMGPAYSLRIFGESLFYIDAYDEVAYQYRIIEN